MLIVNFATIKAMSSIILPVVAAFACAVCNGSAAVLQKISADKVQNVKSLDAGLLWRLFQNKPYIFGIGLDLVGWILTLYAVQYLPLFFVESILAASIVVAAILERVTHHKLLPRRAYAAIGIILTGLVLLALAASPERAEPISQSLKLIIVLSAIPLAGLGWLFARRSSNRAALLLAAVGGFSYGITSVIGRIFTFSKPFWHTVYSPLIFGLIASGALGILLFSTALQRAQATTVNAVMTASQTVFPAIIGIAFLGDSARNGLWYLVVCGGLLALTGVFLLAFSPAGPAARNKA